MQDAKEVVKEVKVENATIITLVPKDEASNLEKEIRHRLDSDKHKRLIGEIKYVDEDYNTKVVEREDHLEVIVTGMDVTIWMKEDTPEENIPDCCAWTLGVSKDVITTGGFNIREHYNIEA